MRAIILHAEEVLDSHDGKNLQACISSFPAVYTAVTVMKVTRPYVEFQISLRFFGIWRTMLDSLKIYVCL